MQRSTHQKKLILEILSKLYHPTANDVYLEAKKVLPSISLATIYRNLNQLVLDKKLVKLDLNDIEAIYDINTHHHDHFVCSRCKRIIDLKPIAIDEISLENEYGIKINTNHISITGLCQTCIKELA